MNNVNIVVAYLISHCKKGANVQVLDLEGMPKIEERRSSFSMSSEVEDNSIRQLFITINSNKHIKRLRIPYEYLNFYIKELIGLKHVETVEIVLHGDSKTREIAPEILGNLESNITLLEHIQEAVKFYHDISQSLETIKIVTADNPQQEIEKGITWNNIMCWYYENPEEAEKIYENRASNLSQEQRLRMAVIKNVRSNSPSPTKSSKRSSPVRNFFNPFKSSRSKSPSPSTSSSTSPLLPRKHSSNKVPNKNTDERQKIDDKCDFLKEAANVI